MRKLIPFIFFLFSAPVFAVVPQVDYWYDSQSAAVSAYQSKFGIESNEMDVGSAGTAPTGSSICASGVSYYGKTYRLNVSPYSDRYVYYRYCSTYTACPAGYEREFPSGQCVVVPNCTAGEQKTLTEFQATGEAVFYIGGGGPDLSDAGCRYECSSAGSTGSYFYDDTGTYRDYSCTATGEASQASDVSASTVPVDAKSSDGSTNSDGQTCSTVGGSTVCVGGDLPENCMTVNGVKTCQSEASADEAVIDDEPVKKTDSKNCVKGSNGEVVCVSDESESEFCGTVNGVKTCYSKSSAQSTGTKTTETLPDGTVIDTQSTTSNIRNNVNDGTTVTTISPDGTVSTVRTGGDNTALQDIAKAAEKSECEKNPNTLGCIGIDDGEIPGADDIQTIDVPITLDYTSWGEAGTCPAGESFDIGGVTQVFSYQPACDLATGIRPVVIASAFIAAALIVFGGVKD